MNKKGRVFLLCISLMLAIMPTSLVFASSGLEREFTIDVSKPNTGQNEKPKTGAGNNKLSDGFEINVENPKGKVKETEKQKETEKKKENETKQETKQAVNITKEEMQKLLEEYKPRFEKNPFKPSNKGDAKGTVVESVGSDNQKYPIRKEIKHESSVTTSNGVNKGNNKNDNKNNDKNNNKAEKKENSAGDKQTRSLAERREFLTFKTKSGKAFHLIVDRDKDVENVQLVTEVTEQDLLNMILSDASGNKPLQEEKPKVEKVAEEPKKEEPKKDNSGTGSFFMLGIIVLAVLGAGYYFKIYKPQHEDNADFEDIEDDGDYFADKTEEINTSDKGDEEEEKNE